MTEQQPNHRYPKEARLRTRGEISRVLDDGRASVGKHVVAKVLKNTQGLARLGLIVSKKNGNAVQRNRIKRRLREVFRLNRHALPPFDIVLIPRRSGRAEASLAELAADVTQQIQAACEKASEPTT